jgi:hypothetical protein
MLSGFAPEVRVAQAAVRTPAAVTFEMVLLELAV